MVVFFELLVGCCVSFGEFRVAAKKKPSKYVDKYERFQFLFFGARFVSRAVQLLLIVYIAINYA